MGKGINVMELFAGVGGFRLGLERADKDLFKTVWANQYEPSRIAQDAFQCYVHNFGGDGVNNEDINKVDETRFKQKDINLIVGGFPCFAAGTLITTSEGYKNIEDVAPGDKVLTHKNRFKEVKDKMMNLKKGIYVLKAQGSPQTLITEEHPVYVRESRREWVSEIRNYKRVFSEPKWVKAKDLEKGKHLIAMSENREEENTYSVTEEEAWLIGRYVADGCMAQTRRKDIEGKSRYDLIYSVGKEKLEFFKENVKTYELTIHETGTAYNCLIKTVRLVGLCLEAGRGAENKVVPTYILNLPKHLLECFLDGYMSGDGFKCTKEEGRYQATSVSKELIYGMGQVVQKLYKSPYRIQHSKRPDKTIIEGRLVNQRDTWSISFYKEERKRAQGYYIDGMVYQPIREIEWDSNFHDFVYNFEVEEDHSYVANNITVRNCQSYSVARTSKSSDGIEGEKGVLFWDIVRMVREIKPRHILLENVDRLLISPSKQRGRDFGIMLKVLHDLGYMVEWRILDASHYGGSQRRVRVFIYAVRDDTQYVKKLGNETEYSILTEKGFFAPNFKVRKSLFTLRPQGKPLQEDLVKVSDTFTHEFNNAGIVRNNKIYTLKLMSIREGFIPLGNILEDSVDEKYYLTEEQIEKFKYLRGSKEIPRETEDGYKYVYKEGAMSELDILDRPSRTILTGEGVVSRTSHIIEDGKGRRFLTPLECERLNNFEDNWTDTLSDRMRYFTMGNALDVSLVERMGKRIKEIELGEE